MDATLMELKKIGVDTNECLERLCGNEALYLKLLIMFEEDMSTNNFLQNYEDKNYEQAIFNVHTLKGVSANLGFKKISNSTQLILNELRNKHYQIDDLVADLKKENEIILNIIRQNKKS